MKVWTNPLVEWVCFWKFNIGHSIRVLTALDCFLKFNIVHSIRGLTAWSCFGNSIWFTQYEALLNEFSFKIHSHKKSILIAYSYMKTDLNCLKISKYNYLFFQMVKLFLAKISWMTYHIIVKQFALSCKKERYKIILIYT